MKSHFKKDSLGVTLSEITCSTGCRVVGPHGPGIASSLRPRVLQKFVAGRGAAHRSGLGLAFCRLAVEAHGGRIWAEGDHASGTTIAFTLPVAH
jgi:NtrC-family two-component system sensor histidine kinase KinB